MSLGHGDFQKSDLTTLLMKQIRNTQFIFHVVSRHRSRRGITMRFARSPLATSIPSYFLLQNDNAINEYLLDENEYQDVAEVLRAGRRLEIGECLETKSFARLRIERTSLEIVRMIYKDFADVLREMNSQARQYAERNC